MNNVKKENILATVHLQGTFWDNSEDFYFKPFYPVISDHFLP